MFKRPNFMSAVYRPALRRFLAVCQQSGVARQCVAKQRPHCAYEGFILINNIKFKENSCRVSFYAWTPY